MEPDPVVAVLTVTEHSSDGWVTRSVEYDNMCDAGVALGLVAESLGGYVDPDPITLGRQGRILRDVPTEAPIRVSEIVADYRITEE